MDKPVIINVDLDRKCKRCGKKGATQSGVCLPCITKAVKAGEFNHIINPERYKRTKRMGD